MKVKEGWPFLLNPDSQTPLSCLVLVQSDYRCTSQAARFSSWAFGVARNTLVADHGYVTLETGQIETSSLSGKLRRRRSVRQGWIEKVILARQ